MVLDSGRLMRDKKGIKRRKDKEKNMSSKALGISTIKRNPHTKYHKGMRCEFCGSRETVPIIYGLIRPEHRREVVMRLEKKYGKGGYVFEGCFITGNKIYCKKCKRKM
jgi:hypothetical protein